MRTFVAVPLSNEIKRQLTQIQSCLKNLGACITWVDPKIFHITLQFFGDLDKAKIAEVFTVIKSGCQEIAPFELGLGQIKLIPNIHRPRVIAIFLDGDLDSFWQLTRRIRSQIQPLGLNLAKEKDPHITLGRIKDKLPPEAKKRLFEIAQDTHFHVSKHGTIRVEKAILMKSTLTQTGPAYTPLVEIQLEKNS